MPFHGCEMQPIKTNGGWRCDSNNDEGKIFTNGFCESQINRFSQSMFT
jgi:hypothetical protein